MMSDHSQPLAGIRVLEMAAIGPVPFAGMMLADMGAEVIRLDRLYPTEKLAGVASGPDILGRGKQSIMIDLKQPAAAEVVLDLAASADVLLEGLRPGTMERLGLGPEQIHERNPRLIYGRMTGYGQSGADADRAGHDINYIAVAGVLSRIGRAGQSPTPPLNLVGDYGGGAMFLVAGILAALVGRGTDGIGRVVDAAMSDGAMLLSAILFASQPSARGHNLLDSGAPFYDAYRCADGKYLAVGPIEPRFWTSFVEVLGPPCTEIDQADQSTWPRSKALIAARLAQHPRHEWLDRFTNVDTCISPVLEPHELAGYQHHIDRGSLIELNGTLQPAPAPRFGRTAATPSPPPQMGASTRSMLHAAGFSDFRVQQLLDDKVLGVAET